MRTKILSTYLNGLSELNAHWAFCLFSSEQFNIDNSNLFENKRNEFSPSVYDENKYRHICNWKLGDISKYRYDNLKYIFNSSYLYAYSVYEIYLDELIEFIINIEQTLKNTVFEKTEENKGFFKTINSIYESKNTDIFDILLIKTHDYLRLRRNIIAHTEITDLAISQGFKNICRDYGYSLNNLWHNDERSLNIDIDFQDISHVKKMDENQIRDLFRLYRKLGFEIDKTIINRYSKNQIVEFYTKSNTQFIKLHLRKKQNRFDNLIRNHFRIEFDDYISEQDISTIKYLTFEQN